MSKKRYRVYGTVSGGKYLGEYEAESADEAVRLAEMDEEVYPHFCHQCADHCEDPMLSDVQAEELPKTEGRA